MHDRIVISSRWDMAFGASDSGERVERSMNSHLVPCEHRRLWAPHGRRSVRSHTQFDPAIDAVPSDMARVGTSRTLKAASLRQDEDAGTGAAFERFGRSVPRIEACTDFSMQNHQDLKLKTSLHAT